MLRMNPSAGMVPPTMEGVSSVAEGRATDANIGRLSPVEFPLLGALRGLAAAVVLYVHLTYYLRIGNPDHGVSAYLTMHVLNYPGPAVVVFFAISGFLIYRPFAHARYEGRSSGDLVSYGVRRLVRIIPAYWVALVISSIILANYYVFEPSGWFYFFFFGQNYFPDQFGKGLPQAWTLDVDALFYIAIPIIVMLIRRLPARTRNQFVATELALAGSLYLMSMLFQVYISHEYMQTSTFFVIEQCFPALLDILASGMALAALSVAYWDVPEGPVRRFIGRFPGFWWLLAVGIYVLIGHMSSFISQQHFTLLWMAQKELRVVMGVALVLPVIFGLKGGGWLRAFLGLGALGFLNTICYGFYLWHIPVLDVLRDIDFRATFGAAPFIVVSVIFSVALGAASWYLIEKPSQQRAREWLYRRKQRLAG